MTTYFEKTKKKNHGFRYTFFKKILHYCNSFFGGQLHIAIFNSFFATIAIAIVLSAIANSLVKILPRPSNE